MRKSKSFAEYDEAPNSSSFPAKHSVCLPSRGGRGAEERCVEIVTFPFKSTFIPFSVGTSWTNAHRLDSLHNKREPRLMVKSRDLNVSASREGMNVPK